MRRMTMIRLWMKGKEKREKLKEEGNDNDV